MSKKYPYLVCGWLAPNGEFTECKWEEHRYRKLSQKNVWSLAKHMNGS